ncbi:MAG: molybdate transport system ATP-binding protein [Halieaceae bacterium]|jgi:molybdate transport system ATP-binding protein
MSALKLKINYRSANGFTLAIDTEIRAQGVTALFGPSGSGKTTVLNCIAGLRHDIESADIRFGEQIWQQGPSSTAPWERELGYVFQDARLFPQLSVAGNLEYAAKRAVAPHFDRQQIIDWLEIGELLERSPTTLSAGQEQRVAIARALMRGPRLLLLDEPLANLDHSAARQCLSCLREVSRQTRLPMIYVSHQIEEVCAIADQLVILQGGRIAAQGPMLELAGRLDTELATRDSAAALLRASVASRDDHYALTEFQVDGQSLWIGNEGTTGALQRLRIPARDVSVCREPPQQSSILNVLTVTLAERRDLSASHCLLRLQLAEQFLLARITRRSFDELQLNMGDRLYAQIKSTALLGDQVAH